MLQLWCIDMCFLCDLLNTLCLPNGRLIIFCPLIPFGRPHFDTMSGIPEVCPMKPVMGKSDNLKWQVEVTNHSLACLIVQKESFVSINHMYMSNFTSYQQHSIAFTESLVDNGTYTITASNPAGNNSVDIVVFIMSDCECVTWLLHAQVTWHSSCLSSSFLCHLHYTFQLLLWQPF